MADDDTRADRGAAAHAAPATGRPAAALLQHPDNAQVLAALARRGGGAPPYLPRDAVPAASAYLGSGSHPDVVERLWDRLGAALPPDSRCLVHGTPALVHPGGRVLAVAMGTAYALRLRPADAEEARAAGARATTTWSGGATEDLRERFGAGWVFGGWRAQEASWCAAWFDADGG